MSLVEESKPKRKLTDYLRRKGYTLEYSLARLIATIPRDFRYHSESELERLSGLCAPVIKKCLKLIRFIQENAKDIDVMIHTSKYELIRVRTRTRPTKPFSAEILKILESEK